MSYSTLESGAIGIELWVEQPPSFGSLRGSSWSPCLRGELQFVADYNDSRSITAKPLTDGKSNVSSGGSR